MTTNVTQEHVEWLDFIRTGDAEEMCLFSCFVNGEPTAALCMITREPNNAVGIRPMFVGITPGMVLTDHANKQPIKLED